MTTDLPISDAACEVLAAAVTRVGDGQEVPLTLEDAREVLRSVVPVLVASMVASPETVLRAAVSLFALSRFEGGRVWPADEPFDEDTPEGGMAWNQAKVALEAALIGIEFTGRQAHVDHEGAD
ncbi:hypothetical protein AB0L40_27145 [Patulibacter sp. NPDC049589]|uniref:hypothetical protein n=1 Tax=Patulibacter sp. NPDC049589 TaxID=3154731 RepID=UPI003441630D